MSDTHDTTVAARRPKETLASFLTAFQAGDFEAVADYLSPEVVVHEPAGIVVEGDHTGVDGWVSMVTLLGQTYEMAVSSYEIVEAVDRAFLVMDPTFTARATGRSARIPIVEVYRFTGGLIVDIDVYYKDPAALAGLLVP